MENRPQNLEIELCAKLSALGGQWRWQDFPISETSAAIASDPSRADGRLKDGWWLHTEHPILREQGRVAPKRGKRFTHDAEDPRNETEKYNAGTAAAEDGAEWKKYLGKPEDDAYTWLSELAKKIDVSTPAHAPWFSVLQSYVGKIPGAKLRDLDQSVLEKILTQLCS